MRTLENGLRELTANLMRIAAGAGSPKQVGDQAAEVLRSLTDLEEIGAPPTPSEMQQMLSYEREYEGEFPPDEVDWLQGMRTMTRAGLRMAASEMLEQNSPHSVAERQFFDGFEIIERIRDRNRRRSGRTLGRK